MNKEGSDLHRLKSFWRTLRGQMYRVRYPGVRWGDSVRLQGRPRIWTSNERQIELGDGVLLNSSPKGYHAAMGFPVTLIADRPGATITIGERSRLHGCCLHAWSTIKVGKRCLLAAGSQVLDAHGHESHLEYGFQRLNTRDEPQPVVIGDDVWLGINAIVLKGVILREGTIVSAGSVVMAGVYPPFSLLMGNPAQVVKSIVPEKVSRTE